MAEVSGNTQTIVGCPLGRLKVGDLISVTPPGKFYRVLSVREPGMDVVPEDEYQGQQQARKVRQRMAAERMAPRKGWRRR